MCEFNCGGHVASSAAVGSYNRGELILYESSSEIFIYIYVELRKVNGFDCDCE